MNAATTQPDSHARRRGATGCVVALLVGGVGLVLLIMGLMPATAEALPFGGGMFVLGLFIAVPSALALRRGWTAEAEAGPVDVAPGDARPPTSVQCPGCGGAAPLRLGEPTHSTCTFCRTRFALAPDLANALGRAATALHHQTAAERQIADTVAALAREEKAWTVRLSAVSGGLTLLAGAVAAFGFATRHVRSDWLGYLSFGVTSALIAGSLGGLALLLVPPAVRKVVGRWSAIRLPGEAGLGCRVCGGPLPAQVAPVLRCAYCAADNLASGEVMARVSATAEHARRGVLAVAQRKQRGDEIAAFTLRSFPWMVALLWFATGAASGSVVVALGEELEVSPNDDERFLVVRAGSPPRACLAAFEDGSRGTIVYLEARVRRTIAPTDLPRYVVAPAIAPAALEGRQLDHRRVVEVFRPLKRLGMHSARVEGSTVEVYLPNVLGGGELLCLTDVAAGSGPSLDLTPAPP